MQNYKLFYCNAKSCFSSVSILNLYNSHEPIGRVNEFNYTRTESPDMNCIFITLKGCAIFQLSNGKEIVAKENSIFFGKYSSITKTQATCTEWHHLAAWFIPQNIDLPVNKLYVIENLDKEKENKDMDRLIRLLQTGLDSKLHYANALFTCKLLEFLQDVNYFERARSTLVDNIIEYINNHIETAILVEDLAKEFHYSKKHLHHLLKTTLNISPKQLINNVKLENICYLLTSTNMTLQELSDKYCFASVSHLINAFKKKYGVAPTKYRKSI